MPSQRVIRGHEPVGDERNAQKEVMKRAQGKGWIARIPGERSAPKLPVCRMPQF